MHVNVTKLSVENAPPAAEPITVGGWYRLIDGSWGEFTWRNGQLRLVARAVLPEFA